MTVANILPVNNYAGDGANKKFDFDFPIENSSELVVTKINSNGTRVILTCDLDYTIDIITDNDNNFISFGQSITFPIVSSSYSTLGEDEKISLTLSLPIEQQKEMRNSNKLNLSTLEWCLDYLTRLIQILNRKTERAIKVQEGSNITTDILVSNLNTVADMADTISNVVSMNSVITSVNNNTENINSVANDLTNIDAVASDLTNIDSASTYSNNANIWAEGTDVQVQALGGIHSSKVWAEVSSSHQIQTDWNEADSTSKAYIKNKPTKLSDFTNDLSPATSSTLGIVKPDNSTILVDGNGVLSADLSEKADKDLSNVNDNGTSLGASWGMPSSTYKNLTLGATGTYYTAPANGWFAINKLTNANNQYLWLSNTTGKIEAMIQNPITGNCVCYVPARKNDSIWIGYNAGGTTQFFRFIYAKGSESEAS